MEIAISCSYLGLFVSAFLAATILPFSSEALLGFLVSKDYNFCALILIASLGNYLGACTNYALGYRGSSLLLNKILRMKDSKIIRAKRFFNKYGAPSLLLSWVPVIGDPLTVVAGTLQTGFFKFSAYVFAGKFARYLLVGFIAKNLF